MRSALSLLVVLVAAGGCGGPGTPASAGVLTVPEALEASSNGPVAVRGALIVHLDEARLCYAMAESYPPQCGEPSLVVSGADLRALEDLERAQGVTWANREITVVGELENEVLTVGEVR